jgi:hypothetical protein
MLTKSTARLIVLVLMTSFVELSDLASAQSRDSNPQPIPRLEEYETEKIKNDFLGHLKDHRSVAYRKESVISKYVRDTNLHNEMQKEYEEVESEMSAIREKYNGAVTMPNGIVDRTHHLDMKRHELTSAKSLLAIRMTLWVEEYDVLSRLEEAEREFKTKTLSKADYRSEERQLRERLFQLRITSQLGQLEWQLSQSLSRIEMKLPR